MQNQLDPRSSILDPDHPIAYFSAEYGIENNLPIYAGGLGVLSGDTVLEAAVGNLPMVAFGILYSNGFDAKGEQTLRLDPQAAGFALISDAPDHALTVDVTCRDRVVKVQAWEKHYGSVHLILIDTDHPANSTEDRQITARLYDPEFMTKVAQEWIFGAASIAFLRKLEITPSIYHLNEGHMGFVAVALLAEYIQAHPGTAPVEAQTAVRPHIVASKHTILSGAGLFIERTVLRSIIGTALDKVGADFETLFDLAIPKGRPDHFSGTKLVVDSAIRENGVSKLHTKSENEMHQHSHLFAITNGVHVPRWRATNLADSDPAKLSDAELWQRHSHNRAELVATINDSLGSSLDPNALTVIWARRITAYKRPSLLFSDLARLEAIVGNAKQPIQFILAGKANAGDAEAGQILQEILKFCTLPELKNRVVYMPGYSIPTTKQLVAAADVWLNTPIRGQEACGTSGMKASLNGALQLSTSDGWIDEVDADFIGWKLPEEDIAGQLYATLEQKIAPLYYQHNQDGVPVEWVKMMRQTIELVERDFSATRMLKQYVDELYFPKA